MNKIALNHMLRYRSAQFLEKNFAKDSKKVVLRKANDTKFQYKIGLKIYQKPQQSVDEQKVLVVKRRGEDQYQLPTMDIDYAALKNNINETKMNLFKNISQNSWKVMFTSLEPDQIDVKKEQMDSTKVKTLFFEAIEFGKSVNTVNPELYDAFKWVPANTQASYQ